MTVYIHALREEGDHRHVAGRQIDVLISIQALREECDAHRLYELRRKDKVRQSVVETMTAPPICISNIDF